MSLKVGFIGTGGIANAHIRHISQIENVKIVGFCDLQKERAEKAAAEHPGAKAYTVLSQMLDDLSLDGVFVCVPPMAHGDAEKEVIKRGIPFLVEKPLGIDWDLPYSLAEEIERKQLITSVGYQWRYIESLKEGKQFLADSQMGMALGYWLGGIPMVPWWRVQNQSGGQFVEQTTHIVDLLRYLCGEVTEVYAAYGHQAMHEKVEGTTVADVGTVTMKLANGSVATISNTCLLPLNYQVGLHVITDQGVLEVHNTGSRIVRTDEDREKAFNISASPGQLETEAFLNAIRTGDASLIKSPYADALKTHAVTIAANESAATGKTVRL